MHNTYQWYIEMLRINSNLCGRDYMRTVEEINDRLRQFINSCK